jgi:hypothetical protein
MPRVAVGDPCPRELLAAKRSDRDADVLDILCALLRRDADFADDVRAVGFRTSTILGPGGYRRSNQHRGQGQ